MEGDPSDSSIVRQRSRRPVSGLGMPPAHAKWLHEIRYRVTNQRIGLDIELEKRFHRRQNNHPHHQVGTEAQRKARQSN